MLTPVLEHVKSAVVVTHSQKGQELPSVEGNEAVSSESKIRETQTEGLSGTESEAIVIPFTTTHKDSFAQEQKGDDGLRSCFEAAKSAALLNLECPERFCVENGLLYRETLATPYRRGGASLKQLVVPLRYRGKIWEQANSSMFGAHMGITRTKRRIAQNIYWPNMGKQIR